MAAAAETVWVVVGEHLAQLNHGCAAVDGENYCAMAQGHLGESPFNRRVLMPLLVRALQAGSVTLRFRIVGVISVVVVVIATFALTRLLAGRLGQPGAAAFDAGVIAASVILLNPWTIRQVWFLPVRTDPTAAAFGVGAIALLFTNRRRSELFSVLGAALAVLSREAWAVPLLIAGVMAARSGTKRMGRAVVVAVASAAIVVALQPATGNAASSAREAGYELKTHFGSLSELRDLLWNLGFPFGLLLVVVLADARWLWQRHEPLLDAILLAAPVLVVLASIGGYDVARLSASAVPFAASVVAVVFVCRADRARETAIIISGSVLVWRPWHIFRGDWTAYHRFMIPQGEPGAIVRMIEISAALVAIPFGAWLVLATRRWRAAR